MKIDLFWFCDHCWVFQIYWHTEYSTLPASSFRILNSSAGIPSSPLALLAAGPSKAHLTSHSRMSGSGWVTTSSRLSRLTFFYDCFVQFFCVFLPSLLDLIFFYPVFTISVLYCAHLCMKCSLGVSNFLEEISILSYSVVFLYFFALIAGEGFLISSCYSLEFCIQMLISFLFSFAFRLTFTNQSVYLFVLRIRERSIKMMILLFSLELEHKWLLHLLNVSVHVYIPVCVYIYMYISLTWIFTV